MRPLDTWGFQIRFRVYGRDLTAIRGLQEDLASVIFRISYIEFLLNPPIDFQRCREICQKPKILNCVPEQSLLTIAIHIRRNPEVLLSWKFRFQFQKHKCNTGSLKTRTPTGWSPSLGERSLKESAPCRRSWEMYFSNSVVEF